MISTTSCIGRMTHSIRRFTVLVRFRGWQRIRPRRSRSKPTASQAALEVRTANVFDLVESAQEEIS